MVASVAVKSCQWLAVRVHPLPLGRLVVSVALVLSPVATGES